MNTIEKRKTENVIREEVQERKNNYTDRREREFDAIKDKLTKKPPEHIQKIAKSLRELKSEREELEAEAEERGWGFNEHDDYEPDMESSYDYKTNEHLYHCKELDEHKAETYNTVKALEALVRRSTLRIYTGSEEMEKLMKEFTAEMDNVIKADAK